MVNKYEIERAQRIYCVIDKSRTMLMPFAGLSLLDYAINASLALSSVILKREDRAGLITFSDKLGDVLTADGKPDQLRRILETCTANRSGRGKATTTCSTTPRAASSGPQPAAPIHQLREQLRPRPRTAHPPPHCSQPPAGHRAV